MHITINADTVNVYHSGPERAGGGEHADSVAADVDGWWFITADGHRVECRVTKDE